MTENVSQPGRGLVHFIHGKESGPQGRKIVALAQIAARKGWQVESLDYTGSFDPTVRLAQLLASCRANAVPLVLVGSSMGGWVAAEAAAHIDALGVFLLAPAFGVPGYPELTRRKSEMPTEIVHGWADDVIPYPHSVAYARVNDCTLHLIHGDHRLDGQIEVLGDLFERFLHRLPVR